jgi:hypothetical protein
MVNGWFSIFIGWVGGVFTGLIANWLFHKYLMWKKSKSQYFTTTMSGDMIEFEGRISYDSRMRADLKKVVEGVLGIDSTQLSETKKGR